MKETTKHIGKVYFHTLDEKHLVERLADQAGMTLPQYLRACMLKVSQQILDENAASQQQHSAPEQVESGPTPEGETSDEEQ